MNDNPFPRRGMRQLSVCVFCGSSHGADPDYAATAKKLGELIALNGYALVLLKKLQESSDDIPF